MIGVKSCDSQVGEMGWEVTCRSDPAGVKGEVRDRIRYLVVQKGTIEGAPSGKVGEIGSQLEQARIDRTQSPEVGKIRHARKPYIL